MNDPKSLIETKILSDGAFLLLSSSSVGRYLRMAESLSRETALLEQLESGAVTLDALIKRVKDLRFQLAAKRQRDWEEVELAVILVILRNTASTGASDLLCEFGIHDHPPMTWVSALARRLFRQQPGNLNTTFSELVSDKPHDQLALGQVRPVPPDCVDTEDLTAEPLSFVSVNDPSQDILSFELAA